MKCARCDEAKEFKDFPRDKRKPNGVAYTCKDCKKIERRIKRDKELKRWKTYYAPDTEARRRHIVRSQTRRKFGKASDHKCLSCGSDAQEWHHYEYKTDSAISLCANCHEKI